MASHGWKEDVWLYLAFAKKIVAKRPSVHPRAEPASALPHLRLRLEHRAIGTSSLGYHTTLHSIQNTHKLLAFPPSASMLDVCS